MMLLLSAAAVFAFIGEFAQMSMLDAPLRARHSEGIWRLRAADEPARPCTKTMHTAANAQWFCNVAAPGTGWTATGRWQS